MRIEIIEAVTCKLRKIMDSTLDAIPRNSERLVIDGDVLEVCDTVYNYDNNRIEIYVTYSKRFYLNL